MEYQPEENLALRFGVYVVASVNHPTGKASRDPNVLLSDPPHCLKVSPSLHSFAIVTKRMTLMMVTIVQTVKTGMLFISLSQSYVTASK